MGCGGCRNQVVVQTESATPKRVQETPEYHPEDGSITFPEGSELFEIQGYEVDEDDERRLISNMPICTYRMTGIMLQKDGKFRPHHICTGNCEHKSKPVTHDICLECPIRSGADSK